jgi:hypothetical protein
VIVSNIELDWSIRAMAFAELIALREQIPNNDERQVKPKQDYDTKDRSQIVGGGDMACSGLNGRVGLRRLHPA